MSNRNETILELRASGLSLEQIARQVAMTKGGVMKVIAKARAGADPRSMPVHIAFDWSEARIETLRKMWATCSSVEIAKAIGPGISRNGVVGKAHRLGLASKKRGTPPQTKAPAQRPSQPRRSQAPKSAPRPIEQVIFDPAPVEIPALHMRRVTIEDLGHRDCKWPLGDPSDFETFRYCGAPAAPERSYCPTHFRIAYTADSIRAVTIAKKQAAVKRARSERATILDLARAFKQKMGV